MSNTSLNRQTSGESGAAFFVTSDINENNTAGSQLNFFLQLPAGLQKITILVVQEKFLGPNNWLYT